MNANYNIGETAPGPPHDYFKNTPPHAGYQQWEKTVITPDLPTPVYAPIHSVPPQMYAQPMCAPQHGAQCSPEYAPPAGIAYANKQKSKLPLISVLATSAVAVIAAFVFMVTLGNVGNQQQAGQTPPRGSSIGTRDKGGEQSPLGSNPTGAEENGAPFTGYHFGEGFSIRTLPGWFVDSDGDLANPWGYIILSANPAESLTLAEYSLLFQICFLDEFELEGAMDSKSITIGSHDGMLLSGRISFEESIYYIYYYFVIQDDMVYSVLYETAIEGWKEDDVRKMVLSLEIDERPQIDSPKSGSVDA